MRFILEEHPRLVQAMYRVAAFRLTTAIDMLDDIRMLPTQVRVAKMLMRMVQSSPGSGEIFCRQDELSQILGLSAVSVVHTLKLLSAQGLIETGYRRFFVPDIQKLDRWVNTRD